MDTIHAEELIRKVKDISKQKSNEKRGKNIKNSCYDAPNDIKVILDKQQKHRKGYRYQDIPHRQYFFQIKSLLVLPAI